MTIMRTTASIIVIILISVIYCDGKGLTFENLSESLKASLRENSKEVKMEQKDFGVGGCPACDSSVYSYCDQKIFHDACCCNLFQQPQCQYSDCSYIHANSCQEHQLITQCCCYNPYRKLL